jgi:ATP-dependent DNA helicase RecQ
MRKGSNIRMMWPSTAPKADSPLKPGSKLPIPEIIANELGFDDALFEKLKRHRNVVAMAEGVPAYLIFSNQTLEFLTRLKPKSLEEGLKIRGVGEKKAQAYLPEFIQVIRKHG